MQAQRKIIETPSPTELFELDPYRLIQYIERGLHHGYGVLGKHLKELEVLSGHVLTVHENEFLIKEARYYKPKNFTNIYSLIESVKSKSSFKSSRF